MEGFRIMQVELNEEQVQLYKKEAIDFIFKSVIDTT